VIPRHGAGRRIALASVAVVVSLVVTATLTLWRNEHAIEQSDKAHDTRVDDVHAEEAPKFFWREREAMNEYLLTPSRELLDELATQRRGFNSATDHIGRDQAREQSLVRRSQAGNREFLAVFRRARRWRCASAARTKRERRAHRWWAASCAEEPPPTPPASRSSSAGR
jgi:hypothetical protein